MAPAPLGRLHSPQLPLPFRPAWFSTVSSRAPTILVVDDYADAADAFVEVLALHGYTALAVYSLDAPVAAVAADSPVIVLLEPEMDRGDGWELARRLLAVDRPPALVAVTTNHRSRGRCRTAGFAAHLLKPYDPLALPALFRALVSRGTCGDRLCGNASRA